MDGCDDIREKLHSTPFGVGTMMWGNTPLDCRVSGELLSTDLLNRIVACASAGGVRFFDTAEGYGGGTCEVRLGLACRSAGCVTSSVLATKFLPTLWRWTESAFLRALDESNSRLGVRCTDLYFLHSPIHPLPIEVWVRAASKAIRSGKMRALGLSNCNADQVRRAVAEAQRLGNVPILANQILFNLMVAASPAVLETMSVCRQHSIDIVAYSPLGQGLLCDGQPRADVRLLRMTGIQLDDLQPLRREVKAIAEAHGSKMSHVAVAYVRAKGAVPLIGCRKVAHVQEALDGASCRLTPDEVRRLDAVALDRHTFEKPRWRRSLFVVFISGLMLCYRFSVWWQRTYRWS